MVKAPGHKRLSIILAVAAYVLSGIPVWWYATSIPRPALPHATMQHLDAALTHANVLLPVAIHLYIVHPDGSPGALEVDADSLASTLLQDLQARAPLDSPGISQVSVVQELEGECAHTSINTLTSQTAADFNLPCLSLLSQLSASQQPNLSGGHPASLDSKLQAVVAAVNASVPGHLVVFYLPGQFSSTGDVLVVGQHRHAWTWFSHASQLSEITQQLAPALSTMIAPTSGRDAVEAAQKLPISPAGQTLLVFTLANAHPPAAASAGVGSTAGRPVGYFSWEFAGFQAGYIHPMAQALSMLMNVHVQSQVRLHTTSKVVARWNKKHAAYTLKQTQLPFFVDSDWALDFGLDAGVARGRLSMQQYTSHTCSTGTGTCPAADDGSEEQYIPAHVLHMVLYVPPAGQQPLRVKASGGGLSSTNSFWMPAWGAVHILPNVPGTATNTSDKNGRGPAEPASDSTAAEPATDSHSDAHQSMEADVSTVPPYTSQQQAAGGETPAGGQQQQGGHVLGADEMHRFVEAVVGSLRVLLGLGAGPQLGSGSLPGVQVLASDVGFSSWEVDGLLRARVAADIASSARVLGSFSRLAQALPNLAMPDLIGQHVSQAIQSVKAAVQAAKAGDYQQAAAAARDAHGAAEQAFSHPAILAQLSFPDSHKVGVYLPFFLPAMLPVVLALASEGKRYIKRRKEYQQQLAAASGIPPGLSVEELDQLHMMRAKNSSKQPPSAAAADVRSSGVAQGLKPDG